MPITTAQLDRLAIRDLIDNWATWRDTGRWDDFRTVWHADGVMMATWFQGGFEDFIAVSQEGFARGSRTSHFHGGTSIDLKGRRAIAQTKMQIAQRGPIEGVACDVVCSGRFYDFLEKRKGRWGIVLRQPIYERDRLAPVDPGASVRLDPVLLARFPEGYRHLAYLQTTNGQRVKPDMPGLVGPELDALYRRGAAWIRGSKRAHAPSS
jgi:SnoaL-like protein